MTSDSFVLQDENKRRQSPSPVNVDTMRRVAMDIVETQERMLKQLD